MSLTYPSPSFSNVFNIKENNEMGQKDLGSVYLPLPYLGRKLFMKNSRLAKCVPEPGWLQTYSALEVDYQFPAEDIWV